jgi:hypothetical protein
VTASMVDRTQLDELERDLARVAVTALAAGTPVVAKGALNIKTDAVERISGHTRHLPSYPRSINYDLTEGPGVAEAEIGPQKDRTQGALGNILEYGSPNRPPIPHLGPALDAEEPRFVAQVEALGARLVAKYS